MSQESDLIIQSRMSEHWCYFVFLSHTAKRNDAFLCMETHGEFLQYVKILVQLPNFLHKILGFTPVTAPLSCWLHVLWIPQFTSFMYCICTQNWLIWLVCEVFSGFSVESTIHSVYKCQRLVILNTYWIQLCLLQACGQGTHQNRTRRLGACLEHIHLSHFPHQKTNYFTDDIHIHCLRPHSVFL